MSHAIKVVFWNARGVKKKFEEFLHYLYSNCVDVACICESFSKPDINLPTNFDYEIYRLDRLDKPKGGIMIMVKKSINHKCLPNLNTKLLEVMGIELKTRENSKIQIFCVYLPRGATSSSITEFYKNDLRKITQRNCSFFAFGDYNSKNRFWNCSRANPAGNILYRELCDNNFIILHPPEPTHYPENSVISSSIIDLVLTNGLHNASEPKCIPMNSDHNAIETEIQIGRMLKNENPNLIPNFKLANWEKYRAIINNKINVDNLDLSNINSESQIDSMVSNLTNTMQHAQHRSVPMKCVERYSLNITPDILNLIKERNETKRLWQRQRNPALKTIVNSLNKQITFKILELKNMNWNHQISNIPKRHIKLWKVTKSLKLRSKQMPPLKAENDTLYNPVDKANLLADHFEKVHQNPLENSKPSFSNKILNQVTNIMQTRNDDILPDYPTENEISLEIKNLKISKSPGFDRIHNSLVKQLPRKGVLFLHLIIMAWACLKLSYFPDSWKKANVVPIHKPGKSPCQATSYRPISLLSSLSKILERIVLKRINDHIDDNNIIPPEQHGFRKQKSTAHQLIKIVTHIKNSFKINTSSTGMIFLDVEKAFDRVWHTGLLYKLLKFRFPIYLIKFIRSYLSNRQFQVTVKNKKSTIRNMLFGLPQGGVLSPTLYNIFTADIPKHAECILSLFADDTSILSTSTHFKTI